MRLFSSMCFMRVSLLNLLIPSLFSWQKAIIRMPSTRLNLADEVPDDLSFSGYDIDVTEQHPRVLDTALKHCRSWEAFSKSNVIAKHTYVAFQEARVFVDNFYYSSNDSEQKNHEHKSVPKYVILDSGCGAGLSSVKLALSNPGIPVIAVDRSFVRLSRNKFSNYSQQFHDNTDNSDMLSSSCAASSGPSNLLMIRAELSDFWYLVCHVSDWYIKAHYILYPNPYPKNKHLQRRWHGHPIFPCLLSLGGILVLRSNWPIYLEEMNTAVIGVMNTYFLRDNRNDCILENHSDNLSSDTSSVNKVIASALPTTVMTSTTTSTVTATPSQIWPIKMFSFDSPEEPMTHFERKYANAGRTLYHFEVDLGLRSVTQRQGLLYKLSMNL